MKILSVAAIALFAATPALAIPITLDFETVPSFESIGNFYNGGAGGALGVSFTGGALGLVNDGLGGGTNGAYFTNAPSPIGVMTPADLDATMNVAAGFRDAIGFSYSSSSLVGFGVTVFDGLNGTGNVLAFFNLADNAQADGCSSSPYCRFDRLESTFEGTARSVKFGAAANSAVFDNVTITTVPEPSTYLLMGAGLMAMGAVVKRRRGL